MKTKLTDHEKELIRHSYIQGLRESEAFELAWQEAKKKMVIPALVVCAIACLIVGVVAHSCK